MSVSSLYKNNTKCCIANCDSTREKITLFKFPKFETEIKTWLKCIDNDRLRRLSFEQLRRQFVCIKHFEKRFRPSSHSSSRLKGRRRLRLVAYPTLFSENEIASGTPDPSRDIGHPLETPDHNYSRKRLHLDHTYCKTTLKKKSAKDLQIDQEKTTNDVHCEDTNDVHCEDTNYVHCEDVNNVYYVVTNNVLCEDTNYVHCEDINNVYYVVTNNVHCEDTIYVHCEDTNYVHCEDTKDVHRGVTKEVHCEDSNDVHDEDTNYVHCEDIKDLNCEDTDDGHCEDTKDLNCEDTSDVHCEDTSDVHCEDKDDVHSEDTKAEAAAEEILPTQNLEVLTIRILNYLHYPSKPRKRKLDDVTAASNILKIPNKHLDGTLDNLDDDTTDTEILELLRADTSVTQEYGPEINEDVATRFTDIATSGLDENIREELIIRHLVPKNCKEIAAPQLNVEFKAALSENFVKRDEGIEARQKQMAAGLSLIGKIITDQLGKKRKNYNLIKDLMDVGRMFCDVQHSESEVRRQFAINTVKKKSRDQLASTKIDKFLFGSNFAETLKSINAVSKSSSGVKSRAGKKRKSPPSKSKPPMNQPPALPPIDQPALPPIDQPALPPMDQPPTVPPMDQPPVLSPTNQLPAMPPIDQPPMYQPTAQPLKDLSSMYQPPALSPMYQPPALPPMNQPHMYLPPTDQPPINQLPALPPMHQPPIYQPPASKHATRGKSSVEEPHGKRRKSCRLKKKEKEQRKKVKPLTRKKIAEEANKISKLHYK